MTTTTLARTDPDPRFTGHSETPKSKARVERLLIEDAQFRSAVPLDSVAAAKSQPGLKLAQMVQIIMDGYADRPALGQRARELVTDPASGRTTLRVLPRFETITYRELWGRARAAASEWHHHGQHPFRAGEFLCVLGFASSDYATMLLAGIHLGAVGVPLQTGAPAAQQAAIIAETEPRILGAGIHYLESAVDAVLAGIVPQRLVVFDYDPRDDDHRETLEAARRRLAGCPIAIDTLDEVIGRGRDLPEAPLHVPAEDEDPLAWLFYTSGSTGTPKGVMLSQQISCGTMSFQSPIPSITLSFMPMSHLVGYGYMFMALANGGMSYCSPKSDLSTLFEDLAMVRPTMVSLVPRVCEMLFHHYLADVDRRIAEGVDPEIAETEAKTDMRETLLGGRLLAAGCGSAVLAPEIYEFMESMLDMHLPIGYSSTEMATSTVLVDWKVQRPALVAYKLIDVPELGYFSTDKPYPRGELAVKTNRFMGGYFKRPDLTAEKIDEEGYYMTGDVMAELGPDHLVYVDRRNNVLKLSQGEFVAVARLEALYTKSPLIWQTYVYGNSARSFLLAVVVPTEPLIERFRRGGADADRVKAEIRRSIQQIADEEGLNSYEIPREILIETESFSLENGLLSGIRKHLRPKLKERYGDQLEEMYTRIAQDQLTELRALRTGGTDRPVLETVLRAVQATLGVAASDVQPDSRFGDLGGDSLSALTFSILLEEIFKFEVPVGVIINPAGDLQQVADYVETGRASGARRPTFVTVHGANATTVKANDLTLDKFIDAETLARAPSLPRPVDPVRTVLLTGATGFLGRFQALAWLEQLAESGGKLVCIARGTDSVQARQRIEAALDSDQTLIARFKMLAADHLEVLPGDLGLPDLGLDQEQWNRLAGTVDLIVHPAAHVNHVLPYNQLFAANVVGTAELIRLALTSRLKRFDYVSTLGVMGLIGRPVDEDTDIRQLIPSANINDSYANGYGISKWAGEVLLREAHDLCGLPVAVFRPGMILADSRYAGQLNVPDMFTRLLYSLAVTGVAPSTFYAEDGSNGRPRARYDGLPVDFLAESITAIGARRTQDFHSYNLSSPHDDGVSLDHFVDWMIDAGCAIERIDKYDEWLARFETAMQALPEEQRHQSMIAILDPYRRPHNAVAKPFLPIQRYRAATETAGFAIPHLSQELITKYVTDLRHLRLLQ